MMRALGVVVFLLLLARPEQADACTCCESTTEMKPLGWSQDGKVLLLEHSSDAACTRMVQLAEWTVDKPAPDGCYNRLEKPDTRIECITPGNSGTDAPPGDLKVQRSKVEKAYAKKSVPIPAINVRVKEKLAAGSTPGTRDSQYDLAVEVHSGKAWKQIWSGTRVGVSNSISAKVWPAPKGDRAMLILTFKTGSRSRDDDTYWVSLAALTPAPAATPTPTPAP